MILTYALNYWDSDYCETLILSDQITSLVLRIDGYDVNASDVTDDLPRAVLISLFTNRHANPDDDLPATTKQGWWGDTYAAINNDKIGSRLWLLNRSTLTAQTVLKAQEYASEALAWLIDDKVANNVQINAERLNLTSLALQIQITRGDKSLLNIRFANVWDYINAF
ncbi:MAG: hypothetical protein RIR39_1550 [Pseudomonadota bacterium]